MNRDRWSATARERIVEATQPPAAVEADGQASTAHEVEAGLASPAAAPRGVRREGPGTPEAGYQGLLRQVPAVVCELDAEGSVLFVNDAASRIVGYQPAELLGRKWWDVLCPGELHDQVDELGRRWRSGDVGDYEMVVRAKDGALKTLAWRFGNEHPADSTPHRIVGCAVDITAHKQLDDELRQSVARLRGALEGTVEAMAMTVEVRDPYTAGHQRRVAALASAIGEEMGLAAERISAIRLAGTIHDIGKIGVPVEILGKHGRITKTEYDLLQAHPEVGYAILKMVDFPWPIAQIVHQHHERFDGSGYPLGLTGDEILLEARILAVADVVESMAGPRPYRPALGIDRAIKEILRKRGVLYDPGVVDTCLTVVRKMEFEWQ